MVFEQSFVIIGVFIKLPQTFFMKRVSLAFLAPRLVLLIIIISGCKQVKVESESFPDPDAEYFAQRNGYYGLAPAELRAAIAAFTKSYV